MSIADKQQIASSNNATISSNNVTIAENEQKVYDAGKQAGIKTEYDRFWDAFQNNGNRQVGNSEFANGCWTDETFNPKYPILIPDNVSKVFSTNAKITDTKVDIHILGRTQQIFYKCTKLKTIRKIIVIEATTYPNMFASCTALENLTMEGTIAAALSLSDCSKLSKASIESVISCLSDTTTGLTATFSTTAKNNAFTTAEWDVLIAAKPNWTIALA